jgi:hypothetical protein
MKLDWLAILVVFLALGVLFTRTNPKRGRPKKKVYWDLVTGPPITPKHSRTDPIEKSASRYDVAYHQFFDDFYYFGDA